MAVILIKHFFIMMCSTYTYSRLMNLRSTDPWIMVKTIALSLAAALGVCAVRQYAVPISIYFMVILSIAYNRSFFHLDMRASITGTIVSFGIVYCAFELAALSVSLLEGFLIFCTSLRLPKWSLAILLGLLQSFLVYSLFKIRWLRNGMPFLMEHGSSELGVYICVSMLFAISVWSIGSGDSRIYIIPACFVFLSGMILWFGWRNRMTTEYMKRVKEKEIASLNETISQQNTQLQCVKRENEELSKIIHKDNKLLPALELAVREYLVSAVSGEASVSDAEAILQTIEQASQERVGIVKSYERQHKIIPKTNIQSLDMMFSYLQRKAESVDADFDLTITGNVSDLPVQQDMDEQDLRTILADLIENAILSEKNTFRRETLVNFYVSDLISFIDVFDSGIPFEASTLANIGVKPASTHLHERGSGIGLMNSFALCKKYDISLEITEFSQDSLFSKKVSLCFDRLGEYRISTPREAAIKALTQREDIRFF